MYCLQINIRWHFPSNVILTTEKDPTCKVKLILFISSSPCSEGVLLSRRDSPGRRRRCPTGGWGDSANLILLKPSLRSFLQNRSYLLFSPCPKGIPSELGRDVQRAERVFMISFQFFLRSRLSVLSSRTGLVLSHQLERTKEPPFNPACAFAWPTAHKKQLALYFCW